MLLCIMINIKGQMQGPNVVGSSSQHSTSYVQDTFSPPSSETMKINGYPHKVKMHMMPTISGPPHRDPTEPTDSLQLRSALVVPGRFITLATTLCTLHVDVILLDPGYLWKQQSCRCAVLG